MGEETPDTTSALRCSFAAELRRDTLPGTAAPADGFLLIEQPGPWGRLAVHESRLDPTIGAAVAARAMSTGRRTLLIRRPGRETATATARRWALVDSTPLRESIRWATFGSDEELLDLPLDGSAGTVSDEPCYLVCTHGRHDACCAIRGRPVAAALARARGEQVWECSHVGGDRFAPNLVVLPHGFYYGRVDDDAGREVVAAQERNEVALPWLRGRATFASPAQVAQQFARLERDERRVNALNPTAVEVLGPGRWRVRVTAEPADLLVSVASVAGGPAALLTCAATHAAHPPDYRLEEMQEASEERS